MRLSNGLSPLALSVLTLTVLAAACDNIDWVSKANIDAPPTAFRWRGEELWAVGANVLRRSTGGDWDSLDMCAGFFSTGTRGTTDVSFEGDTVWALCTSPGGLQQLIRWDGPSGTRLELPIDGRFALVDSRGGVVLAGQTSLHRRQGEAWMPFATYPAPYTDLKGAALGLADIYLYTAGVGARPAIRHWNGSHWADVAIDERLLFGSPSLREGRAWLQNLELKAGEALIPPFSEALWKDVVVRELGLAAYLPSGHGFFGVLQGDGAHYWEADTDDDELSWVGDAPFTPGSATAGGGISASVAIDEDTLLTVYSTGAGIGAASATYELIEGDL